MKKTMTNERFFTKEKKLMVLLMSVIITIGAGIWYSKASATNITYAKYNGVEYASVILDNDTIDDHRYYALLKAQQMVTVQWTSPVTFSSWYNSNGTYSTTKATDGTTSTGSFLSGKTYVGIPYSMANHSADDVKWMQKITSGVTSNDLSTYYNYSDTHKTTAYGADCSYFVYQALKAADTGYSFGYNTTSSIASCGHYTKIATCADYSSSNIDSLFAQLTPGDIALKSGHVMLYVGRTGNNFAFFEAAAPVTRYVTYNLTHMIDKGYTFYKFNGFNDVPENPYGYTTGAYQVYTSTGETLNIRSGASVDYEILGEIPDLTKVIVTEVNGYWGKTTYNGITGWISLAYCNYLGSANCEVLYCIDYPQQNAKVNADATSVYLQGWTLDKHEISKITYAVNDGAEVAISLASRKDVADAYPSYPSANNSWSGRIPVEMLQSGKNNIAIYAYCSTGKKVAIGTRTVNYAGGSADTTACDTKYCIDYPTQNANVEDTSVYVQGWTLDMHGIDKVTYAVNGGAEKSMTLGSRSDVADAYPAYPAENNSWNTRIPVEALQYGNNTIAIYAYCKNGKKVAIGSRTVTYVGESEETTTVPCDTKYCIDFPTENSTVTDDVVYVQGWTVDNHEIENVTYSVNGGSEQMITLNSRADVAAAYPTYPEENNSWNIKVPVEEFVDGLNEVAIYAYCKDGKKIEVGNRTVTVEK